MSNLEQFLKNSLSSALANNGVNANYSSFLDGNVFHVTLSPLNPKMVNPHVLEQLKKAMLTHAQASNVALPAGLQINIYNTAVRKGKLLDLKDTRLYQFFISVPFQHYVNQNRR